MQIVSAQARHSGPSQRLSPAAALCGWMVLDRSGDAIGSISDLMLDLERGRVAYAVIASGGFVGVGEKIFAVPWSALKNAGRHFVLQASRSALDSGPALDPQHWPATPARWWHEQVHAHFHSRPYWE